MALSVALDSKIQYPAACNAIETLLLHKDIASLFLKKAIPLFNDNNVKLSPNTIGSIKIISGIGELDIYEDCNLQKYHASIYSFDGCVRMYSSMPTRSIKVVSNTLGYPQPQPYTIKIQAQPHILEEIKNNENSEIYKNINNDEYCPHYLIVYSCESSRYFGYQTQSNYYGFLTSKQHKNAHFLRLLTSSKIDDMASYIPTFTMKRHPYSRRYQPLNKGDSLLKWYQSPLFDTYLTGDGYDIQVIAVIDPDNWIIRDVSKWVRQVKKGHALGKYK